MTLPFNIKDLREILWDTHKDLLSYHIPKDVLGEVLNYYNEMSRRIRSTPVLLYIQHMGGTTHQRTFKFGTSLSVLRNHVDNFDMVINGQLVSPTDNRTLEEYGVVKSTRILITSPKTTADTTASSTHPASSYTRILPPRVTIKVIITSANDITDAEEYHVMVRLDKSAAELYDWLNERKQCVYYLDELHTQMLVPDNTLMGEIDIVKHRLYGKCS